MKKILLTSALATSLFTQVSVAEIKLGNAGTLSGSVGVASQYVFRGFDYNRDKPAVFGSIEYQTPAFGAIKPYLGIFGTQFASNYEDTDVETDPTASYELDYSAGIRTSLGKLNIDLGYVLMTYEGGRNERQFQVGEYGAKLSYPVDKLTLNANYFLNDTDGVIVNLDESTVKVSEDIWELGFGYDLGVANLVALYREVAKATEGYDIALQKNVMGVDAEIKYTHAQGKGTFSSDPDDDNLVFTISKSF
jgi:uncharacterized protein (TIGR02001 family)